MLDFFNVSSAAFGLDISDLSVKAVQLKKKKGGFFLSSFGEFQVPAGVIDRGQIKEEKELADILKRIRNEVHGTKIQTPCVVASLPEEQAFLQIIQLPRMSKDELESAV